MRNPRLLMWGLAAAMLLAMPVGAAPGGNGDCANYGVVMQAGVGNNYSCKSIVQHCHQGTGAGAGAGAGGPGSSEAGAEATAGTNCTASNGCDGDPGTAPSEDPSLPATDEDAAWQGMATEDLFYTDTFVDDAAATDLSAPTADSEGAGGDTAHADGDGPPEGDGDGDDPDCDGGTDADASDALRQGWQ